MKRSCGAARAVAGACVLGWAAPVTAAAPAPTAVPVVPAVPAVSTVPATSSVPAASPAPSGGPAGPEVPHLLPRLLIQSDAVILHQGPNAPAIEDGTTRPGFYLRRARAGIDVVDGLWAARLIGELTARAEVADAALDPIAGELARGRTRATEAFLAFAPGRAFVLAMGALRVPLGLSRQVDEGDLRLPERARIITRATPDFRMGVAAHGDLGLAQYALGLYGVAPTFGSDFLDGGSMTVARLAAEPLGPLGVAPQLRRRDDPWYGWWRFSAGVSAFYATLPGANEFGVGGDGQVQWARFLFVGELLWTRQSGADRLGFTVEPGVFVFPDRLELTGRFERFYDRLGSAPSAADGWGTTVGATFFGASRRARLSAAYTLRRAPVGGDRASSWGVVRATFTL